MITQGKLSGAVLGFPPETRSYLMELPLCTLHVMEAGSGPPMIVVPATLSELNEWKDLVQFMAQWFHVYFFELPGHGRSTPLAEKFTTDQMAQVVAQLADQIGAQKFTLMGFSFGGILAMKTFLKFQPRIERIIFLSPCLTARAVRLSPSRRMAARLFSHLLMTPAFRSSLLWICRTRLPRRILSESIHWAGRVEKTIPLNEKIARLRSVTMDVIACELEDILTSEFFHPQAKHKTSCYFAMSIHDPLLHYQTTLNELHAHFANIIVLELFYPFHQPPKPFTFDEMNQDFGATVDAFMSVHPAA